MKFQRLPLFSKALRHRARGVRQRFDACCGQPDGVAGAEIAAPPDVKGDVIECCSSFDQPRRQVEQPPIALVGRHQVQVGVEDGESLRDEIDGLAQRDLGVEAASMIGFQSAF